MLLNTHLTTRFNSVIKQLSRAKLHVILGIYIALQLISRAYNTMLFSRRRAGERARNKV